MDKITVELNKADWELVQIVFNSELGSFKENEKGFESYINVVKRVRYNIYVQVKKRVIGDKNV